MSCFILLNLFTIGWTDIFMFAKMCCEANKMRYKLVHEIYFGR